MIVYNISMKVETTIEQEWLAWQRNDHIPEVMRTGLFTDFKFYRLLEQEDPNAAVYVVQYFCSSLENYNSYVERYAPSFRDKVINKWGDRFIAFRTIMELVN